MTWRKMIEAAMAKNGEAGAPVRVVIQRWDYEALSLRDGPEEVTLEHLDLAMKPRELERSFIELRFTIWTPGWVYFPATYDSRYWVASVP